MKVYLDDVRPTPDGWVRTYTSDETIKLLNECEVSEVSLDHDLDRRFDKCTLEYLAQHPEIDTGMKVVNWLLDNPSKLPTKWTVHSANTPARERMTQLLSTINCAAVAG